MQRIQQAWSRSDYIGVKMENGVTAYIHPGKIHYHFRVSHHGVEHAKQQAEAWAQEIGGTLVEYTKEQVYVVEDRRGVGRTKRGTDNPAKIQQATQKILDDL